MISAFGVEHGDEVSKALKRIKMPKLGSSGKMPKASQPKSKSPDKPYTPPWETLGGQGAAARVGDPLRSAQAAKPRALRPGQVSPTSNLGAGSARNRKQRVLSPGTRTRGQSSTFNQTGRY